MQLTLEYLTSNMGMSRVFYARDQLERDGICAAARRERVQSTIYCKSLFHPILLGNLPSFHIGLRKLIFLIILGCKERLISIMIYIYFALNHKITKMDLTF